MKNFKLTPTNLRIMLSISMFVIIAIATGLATLSYNGLKDVAVDVSHTSQDASASQNDLRTLQQIQEELEDNKEVVDRANSIVAESKSYQYQDQIIADLNDYANRAGVGITNIDFSSTATTTNPTNPQTPSSPSLSVPGVKSTSVSVTLKNPLNYTALLHFLHSIEQNLTKMQISKVSLTKDAASGNVASEALTIEVYIR